MTGGVQSPASRVRCHFASFADLILPVDVAGQQGGRAFLVRRGGAVAYTLIVAPVYPPVVGYILYGGPLICMYRQQPVNEGTGVWEEQINSYLKRLNTKQSHLIHLKDVLLAVNVVSIYLMADWVCSSGLG